ncbi:serine/threonine-protein phosphatase 6 regulatory ankyrin repeat subunit A-like [Haliotis asinina]|uniref:serine/threonine-protein phosphatase 6 regulatory ankyrin repeat subunit A-like n=1 Tax=Haliotis asinina TaxID=109174 RepID=UPI00353264C1
MTDLHGASMSGDLSKVNFILSQEKANIDRKDGIGRTPAMWAAAMGHMHVVELLVNKGAKLSLVDSLGLNILHAACLFGDVEVVKYVISRDCVDINGRVRCGRTPVMLAAVNGHKEIMELLVAKGANVTLTDKNGNTILHRACRGGDIEVVKYIVSKKMVDINTGKRKNQTSLMLACLWGHKAVVELLVQQGANHSLTDKRGDNILHYACQGGHVEVVTFIISLRTFDINCGGLNKQTPFMAAGRHGHKDVVELLVKNGANLSLRDAHSNNILHLACGRGRVEVVKYVISLNTVDINSWGNNKKTPIMVAGRSGHTEVIRLLVKNGADLSLRDAHGDNILYYACLGGHVEVVKYVVSKNRVDINSRGKDRKTPVMVAGARGHKDVVELLVKYGANLSLRDAHGDNILYFACLGGHVEVVKYVVSKNRVDINSRGKDKKTPVMVAGESGHRNVVELLVKYGANLSLRDAHRNNILHLACGRGHVGVVKYVISQDTVDINSRGNNKKTPIMVAGRRGHTEVIRLLVKNGADLSLRDAHGDNILYHACLGGHVEVVKYVVSKNRVDINSRGKDKKTPVMVAGERGHKDVVELLVKYGANLSLRDAHRNNILHLACGRRRVEVIKCVISHNVVDINSIGKDKKTPVMVAGETGQRDVVKLLVKYGANLSLRDAHGDNILYYACLGGHVEVVKYVVSQHVQDINRRRHNGRTLAMVAGERGHRNVVELLVKYGANLSLRDAHSNNILHLVCGRGHVGVVKYVISQDTVDINSRGNNKKTPIMVAGRSGHTEVIRLLVKNGADLSLRDAHGDNILYHACFGGHVEVVKYVVSKNRVDINSRGKDKKTPVMVAGERGHKDVVELLVKYGANLSFKDVHSNNILHLACRSGHVSVVEYVLSQGTVDVNAKNEKRESAATIARTLGRLHVLEVLLSHGAEM